MITAYPTNTRWLSYDRRPRRGVSWETPGLRTLGVLSLGAGSAAAAWGLMHLALHLLS